MVINFFFMTYYNFSLPQSLDANLIKFSVLLTCRPANAHVLEEYATKTCEVVECLNLPESCDPHKSRSPIMYHLLQKVKS